MATILLRKPTAPGVVPIPLPPAASGALGEPFWSPGGFTDLPPHVALSNDLAIHDGTALVPLISPMRQVELTGAQTIDGVKSFAGAGAAAFAGVANMTFGDGTVGQVLTKGAGSALAWADVAAGTVYNWGIGLTETTPGTIDLDAATAAVIGGVSVAARTATQGLDLSAAGALTLPQATALLMGGVALALATDMDALAPSATAGVTPARVRDLMGAQVSTLATTAKTVVPAINELAALVAGTLTFAGSYDVLLDEVDPVGAGASGPLPAASAANNGRFVICITAGPGIGNAAAEGPYVAEDWLICGEVPSVAGTYAWHKLSVGGTAVTADNVGITAIPGLIATDVQGALEALELTKLETVAVEAALTGDGTTAAPLDLVLCDGGVF